MHAAMRMRSVDGLAVDRLAPQDDALRKLQDAWEDVQSLLLEELSMWPPNWLWALAYRLGCILKSSKSKDGLNVANPMEVFFGGVALVRMNADFLQLPPVRGPSLCSRPLPQCDDDYVSQG